MGTVGCLRCTSRGWQWLLPLMLLLALGVAGAASARLPAPPHLPLSLPFPALPRPALPCPALPCCSECVTVAKRLLIEGEGVLGDAVLDQRANVPAFRIVRWAVCGPADCQCAPTYVWCLSCLVSVQVAGGRWMVWGCPWLVPAALPATPLSPVLPMLALLACVGGFTVHM